MKPNDPDYIKARDESRTAYAALVREQRKLEAEQEEFRQYVIARFGSDPEEEAKKHDAEEESESEPQ